MAAALLSGTALAMIFLVGAPAFAGEIDVLKEQLQALQKKVEQIETNQTTKMTTKGRPKVQLEVSGHVNRALLFADNGDHEQLFNVDNSLSGTRVRWVAKARLNDDLSAGAKVELSVASNGSGGVVMGQNSSTSFSVGERHMAFWLDSKKMGRVWLGQTSTASDGTSEVDLSGTAAGGYSAIDGVAGGICFAVSGGSGPCDGPTIGDLWSNLDGLGRNDLIRYDTPTIAGFKASASYVEADTWDIALRYSANYEAIGTKVSAAIAFVNQSGAKSSSDADHQLNGSISALHSSGLSVTYAMGERAVGEGDDDRSFWYIKGGWQMDMPSPNLGRFAISFDYGQANPDDEVTTACPEPDHFGALDGAVHHPCESIGGDDEVATSDSVFGDDEITTWGIIVTQKVAKLGAEFYFTYRNHDLDHPDVDYNDINVAMLGARIKF
jgi:predicted porin